jgi:hypothetical protein
MKPLANRRKRKDAIPRAAVPLLAASLAVSALIFVKAPAADAGDPAAASATEDVSPPSTADWESVDPLVVPGTADDTTTDRVLEVPQVVDPNSTASAQSPPADPASAAADPDSGSETASTSDGSGNAGNDDGSSAPEQIGSINEYENQQADMAVAIPYVPPGTYISSSNMPPPTARIPRGVGAAPPWVIGAGSLAPGRPLYMTPNTGGALPSTSPMLMPSPHFLGSMPGGWWTPAHR